MGRPTRAEAATAAGLHFGFAFPVRAGAQVLGVIEIYGRYRYHVDDDFLDSIATLGQQIGQYLRRKWTEDERRRSEALKAAILEAALDCVISINDESRIIEWNPAAERTFGYTREAALGKALPELIIPPEYRDKHYEGLARYLATGEGRVLGRRRELEALRADGSLSHRVGDQRYRIRGQAALYGLPARYHSPQAGRERGARKRGQASHARRCDPATRVDSRRPRLDHLVQSAMVRIHRRAYRKNDQAWMEQKNGAIVRRLVGYGRLEGLGSAQALARLYAAARLHTNLFQPSFKLKQKTRIGARVIKCYHPPVIPADRVLAHAAVEDAEKAELRRLQAVSDPVVLIAGIRAAQAELGKRVDRRGLDGGREPEPSTDLDRFTAGLRIAWRAGEQRPTHRRPYRRRKPIPRRASMLDDLRGQIGAWLAEEPGLPAIAILERTKTLHPDHFTDKHARTVQRAVKQWRAEQAHRIITESAAAIAGAAVRPAA
jgi:PAS domain S-box-containing protein